MKRFLSLILFATLIAAFLPKTCLADDENTTIILIEQTSGFGDTPIIRSPDLVPIEAVYYPAISTILVEFHNDLGSVSVEIGNLTTGAYSQTTVNATQGVYPFLITGDEGVYEITFTLSNGQVYLGSFEIE